MPAMMLRTVTIFFFLGLCLLLAGKAAAQVMAVRVGDAVILLPAPAGFIEVSARNRTMRQFALLLTPAQSQFMAFYVPASDWQRIQQQKKPRLVQYMLAFNLKKMSLKSMKDRDFRKIREVVRQKFGRTLKAGVKRGQKQLNRVGAKLTKDAGVNGLRVGHLRPLGVIQDSRRTISYAVMTKYIQKEGDKNREYLMVGTISFALVKGKLLKLYVFRYFQNKSDLIWVKTKTRQWTRRIQRRNSG